MSETPFRFARDQYAHEKLHEVAGTKTADEKDAALVVQSN